MLNTERDTVRRLSQDLATAQGSNSNLEADVRVAQDQRRQLQDSHAEHTKKVQFHDTKSAARQACKIGRHLLWLCHQHGQLAQHSVF